MKIRRSLLLVTSGWLTMNGWLVEAQNGSSFLDADRSSVRYDVASSKPRTACDSLVSLTTYDYSVI